ncbi:Uma2 family endonuclease [soil metagenome]
MGTAKQSTTIENLEQLPESESRFELIRGELIPMPPAGFDHGDIALAIGTALRIYAREHQLGRVAGAETGYVLSEDPDIMLAPDASFVLTERLPPRDERRRFLRLAPDLAVEVVSPNDSASYVQSKVKEYLEASVRLVWIVDPETQSVTIYDSSGGVRFLGIDDQLDGADVLPGFSVPIAEIFD